MSNIHALVDRIEGDKAVLLIGEYEDQTLVLPVTELPDGSGSGSVLTIELRYEPELTERARDDVSDIIRRLRDRS